MSEYVRPSVKKRAGDVQPNDRIYHWGDVVTVLESYPGPDRSGAVDWVMIFQPRPGWSSIPYHFNPDELVDVIS